MRDQMAMVLAAPETWWAARAMLALITIVVTFAAIGLIRVVHAYVYECDACQEFLELRPLRRAVRRVLRTPSER